MENFTSIDLARAEIWLIITTLIYFLMNGAQIFETLVFVPKWTASAPESIKLLNDKNGVSLKTFWILFHSLHEITFILAIVFCWKIDPIRNWLIVLFAIHFAVRVWTILYFASNIIDFQKIAETTILGNELLNRTSRWRTLNYFRVSIFIAISIGLIPLCMRVINFKY